MNKWEDLTLSEKSEMMRVAVENGITNLPDIRQAYNEFAEGGAVSEAQPTVAPIENIYGNGGYKPSERIKQRITHYEGKAMTGAKDPLSGKWGKNNSFDSEAKNFYNALPKDIREQVLSNPDLADSLYSYSYNVGAERFRERVVPALRNYYHGKGTVQDIENSMWASGDSKLKGLQRRRAEERKGVRSALIGDIPYLPSNTPSYPTVYDTPQFVPANPQAFYTSPTAYQPVVLPDEQQPIVREALAYDPKEIERQERQRGLNNFMTLMSMTSPQESDNPYLDTIGMLAGNQFKKGGKIYIKPKNRGKFTKLKERTGHSATWFKEHGTPAQKKMATFALNSRHWKHGLGGNLFDGTTEDSQQMNRPNIYRYNDGRYVYQAAPDAEEIEVSPINTLLPNPAQWTYQDAEGKVYTPHTAQVDTGSITQDEDTNPLLRAANNYMREAAYRAKDGTLALQGKYTMPAIAASALLPLAGEAFAGSTIAGVPATTWANTALTAGFAGHGLNHAINEGINGWGDAAMTALELAPLGQLAKPVWDAGKIAVYNIADRYMFMPHQNSFTRGIGMTDAGLQDAVTTGVFRGNPRGTEVTAKQFTKLFERNRDNFRDIMDATGIEGIASKFQSRTLSEAEFNAIKEAAKKYKMKRLSFDNGNISPVELSADPLYEYPDYASYMKSVNETIANVEKMPSRIASGEIKVNTELTPTVDGVPHGRPIEERFGPNSDYVGDGQPLSYWYDDGRNPLTRGHSYAKSNYGVRVNNPEDYTPFMHELHLHPSFFKTPQLADPNVEIFGKGPLGLTVKLDKETLQPLWKRDLSSIFRKGKSTTPQITAENAANTTPEQWNAAYRAAYERGNRAEGQRLWDLWFKQKAPYTKQATPMFNASGESTFNEFNGGETGLNWFSESEGYAANHGVPRAFYINEPDIYFGNVPAWIKGTPANGRYIESLKRLGYTEEQIAQKVREINEAANSTAPAAKSVGMGRNNELVTRNNNTMKLAEPFTFADDGSLIDLTKRADFSNPDIRYARDPSSYQAPYLSNGRQGLSSADFTDFDTMVERMNSNVEYSGKNPFKDGKMTGFRKWALDNGASPADIAKVEKEFSGNNWSKLRREFTLDTNRPSAYVPDSDEVTINQLEDGFNYAFPHEVEHRLFYKLFGDNRNSVSISEINAAFRGDSPMWKINNSDGQYFFDNNFEEIINRFTQIKNALGIKKARALTAEELKRAYKMFREGSPKIEDNDMGTFFDSIKDWKAAAKLSGKALTTAGTLYTVSKTINDGQ